MSRPRALVISRVLPEFDRERGSKRAGDLVAFLLQDGYQVTFVSELSSASDRYARSLRQAGVETYTSVPDDLSQIIARLRPDIALCIFWHVAQRHAKTIREFSPGTALIVDSVDLHFLRRIRQALSSAGPGAVDSQEGSAFAQELTTYAQADCVLTISDKERDLLVDLVGARTQVVAVSDFEDVPLMPDTFEARKGIAFVGNFQHAPNIDAAKYLITEVLPLVDPGLRAEHPVCLLGNKVSEIALPVIPSYVRLIGWVPSLHPYLAAARISAVPIRYGAGTKGKLIQAIMLGTPTVATTVGAEGLALRDAEDILIADDSEGFAKSIERLLTDKELWQRIQASGRERLGAGRSRSLAGSQAVSAWHIAIRKRAKDILADRFAPAVIADALPERVDIDPLPTAGTWSPASIEQRRPSIATRHRLSTGAVAANVLVLGVYLADKQNVASDIVNAINRSTASIVVQRWLGLGGLSPDPAVAAVTVDHRMVRTPKFTLINSLLARERLDRWDYVIVVDDDVVLPEGFVDAFVRLQAKCGFAIAQPARTSGSSIDHPIVEQQMGVIARETLFVEIGPVVSFHRSAYEAVFPFDERSPMGWGYENVWARQSAERGLKIGIIDAVPVDHSLRPTAHFYLYAEADGQRTRYLGTHPHLPLDECMRVLDVITSDGRGLLDMSAEQ